METVDASLFLDARLQVLGAAVAERGLAEKQKQDLSETAAGTKAEKELEEQKAMQVTRSISCPSWVPVDATARSKRTESEP